MLHDADIRDSERKSIWIIYKGAVALSDHLKRQPLFCVSTMITMPELAMIFKRKVTGSIQAVPPLWTAEIPDCFFLKVA